ncbi:hypothetical protein RHDC4_00288 [Rhodocyclaceae bacterium]|nr:hypothetical protein RHDC4_00288 [Rhodocyclaceae bacterium]
MTEFNAARLAAALLVLVAAGNTGAQVSVRDREVKVGTEGVNARAEGVTAIATDGGKASVTVGGIAGDADIQGITVINGRVSIDGKDVPANVTRYKSPRTGTVYLIQRKNGAVSVTTEEGTGK